MSRRWPVVRDSGHVGFWPCIDQVPSSYPIYGISRCEVTLRLAAGWCVHLPATADGSAYLRRLATVIAECAEAVEEAASQSDRCPRR